MPNKFYYFALIQRIKATPAQQQPLLVSVLTGSLPGFPRGNRARNSIIILVFAIIFPLFFGCSRKKQLFWSTDSVIECALPATGPEPPAGGSNKCRVFHARCAVLVAERLLIQIASVHLLAEDVGNHMHNLVLPDDSGMTVC